MAQEKEKPLTRKDVLDAIARHGGVAWGLDLSGRRFAGAVDLRNLNLGGIILNKAVLLHAKFDGSNLKGAQLREANLQHATFNKYNDKVTNLAEADLSSAHLDDAEFRYTNLEGAQFGGTEESIESFLTGTDFRHANLLGTDFNGCSFFRAKLEGAYLFGANIYDSHLEDADWCSYIIGEETKKRFYLAEDTYRRLKAWYTNADQYDVAGKFYYREMEARRKALRWRSKRFFRHRLALELSYRVFGYGEGWKRLLFWIAGLILLFAFIYFAIGTFMPSFGTLTPNTFLHSLYYSAVSFTALGYGSWSPQPTGWIKGIGAFEAFVGVFTIALLLVTFVRKWTR